MEIYKKQKKIYSKLYKKERKKYYSKTDIRKITVNETFWKTITPLNSGKAPSLSKITLIENEIIISAVQKVVETKNSKTSQTLMDFLIKWKLL